jgi:hypothetical protein
MQKLAFLLFFIGYSASAQNLPTDLPTGATAILNAVPTDLSVPGIECKISGFNQITCTDVGKTCTTIRAREQKRHEREFGCIDPKSKNYPCPTDKNLSENQERWNTMLQMQCEPHIQQTLKCSDDLQHCE